ncbi:MAG: amidohydrolase family protein [Candidatus Eisenbacteria bacterium]|nr:amidohydrolase family protein [Candidatus Eisenbacteria bacterium]
MKRVLLKGGRLIDPSTDTDERLDVLVEDGRIAAREHSVTAEDARVIDVSGLVVAPGLVDMHVHFRDPGREDEETILSGSTAAAHGGVTSVATMPNTDPSIDTRSWVEYIAGHESPINVFPIAAITMGRKGESLTEMAELARAGAVGFSDDGSPVVDANVMRRALEYASMVGRPVIAHCEDPALARDGVANEGPASTMSGLRPVPAAAEVTMVARDIVLAKATGARLHIAHVSTAGAVDLVRRAKEDGVDVTCETCPHYFSLTDNEVRTYDTNVRVNPPLRSESDVRAIREGLADGTIDVIASDHAPHSLEEKQVEFDAAPPGMIGVETLLPVALKYLVEPGHLSLGKTIELLACGPAGILGIERGTLTAGAAADVVVLDPERSWTPSREWFRSKSKNSPFIGRELRGRAVLTLVRGEVAFEHEDLAATPDEGDSGEEGDRSARQLPLHA